MDYKQAVLSLLSSGQGKFVENLRETLNVMVKIVDTLNAGKTLNHKYAEAVTESA